MRILWQVAAVLMVFVTNVLAYGGEEAAIQSFFDRTINFLSITVGGGMVVIGLIVTGFKLAGHKEDAIKSGIMVVGGGALVFMAPTILKLIKSFAG
ncbi:MAG: TrbC/VirB2 family protein [Elusimicrobiota bacterium]